MIAPSLMLRDIWYDRTNEREYKSCYESIFANLHDSFKLSKTVVNDEK